MGSLKRSILFRAQFLGRGVVVLTLPLMVVTGLAMAPAVTAAYPVLQDLFGGSQSARTVHFFAFAALVLFLGVHVAMVVLTGFQTPNARNDSWEVT